MRIPVSPIRRLSILLAALVALALPRAAAEERLTTTANAIPAFPGAEGFGAITPGGRRGAVLAVTSLADAGPGTLRAADRMAVAIVTPAEGPSFGMAPAGTWTCRS